MREKSDGVIVALQPASFYNRQMIIDFMYQHRIPTIYPDQQHVRDGGLMCYAVDYTDLFGRVASYVDKSLQGANPGDLPIQQPTTFNFVINFKAARAIGLEIPPLVIAQAPRSADRRQHPKAGALGHSSRDWVPLCRRDAPNTFRPPQPGSP